MNTAMRKEFLKAKNVGHPNSRKSIAIARRAKKISNRQKAKMTGMIKQNLVGEKMIWIKENMVPDVCPYTPELTGRLLETYIARNDEEMEQINIKRSIGGKRSRQHASREDIVRMTKEREMEEYNTCGIEIPDILNPTQCGMLRNWTGELKYMNNFKFRRFGRKHLSEAQQKASKEPKEQSNKSIPNAVPERTENSCKKLGRDNAENSSIKSSNTDECNRRTESTMDTE